MIFIFFDPPACYEHRDDSNGEGDVKARKKIFAEVFRKKFNNDWKTQAAKFVREMAMQEHLDENAVADTANQDE